MLRQSENIIRKLILFLDGAMIWLAFLLSFAVRRNFHGLYNIDLFPAVNVIPDSAISLSDYLVVLFLGALIWCCALYSNGMYRSMRTRKLHEILGIIVKSTIWTAIVFSTAVFSLKLEFVSRFLFVSFMASGLLFLTLEKIVLLSVVRFFRRHGFNYRRILLAGSGDHAVQFVQGICDHPEWGMKLVGVVNEEGKFTESYPGSPSVLGSLPDLAGLIRRFSIDEVVFVMPHSKLSLIEGPIGVCETLGIKATVVLDLFNLKIAKTCQSELDGVPLLSFETTSFTDWQALVKRCLDVILSGLGILLISPLLLVTGSLVKATSKGPVFFLQKRMGLNGRKFVLYKFRTMREDAQRSQRSLAAFNVMQGPVFKMKCDPRVTPLGRFLRKFSIDELPQLFNVFLGHMSLVGPRPPLPREVKKYENWQRRRLSMPPGITCLWQINGRNKVVDFDEWMKLDLEYIDQWSFWLDVKVLFKTIPVALTGAGAY